MTCKLIALYRKPADVDGFLRHYHDVHMPLVKKVPWLEKAVVNRVIGAPSETDLFMIAELHFTDRETFKTAMRSEENRAAGRDLMHFAKDIVSVVFTEDDR